MYTRLYVYPSVFSRTSTPVECVLRSGTVSSMSETTEPRDEILTPVSDGDDLQNTNIMVSGQLSPEDITVNCSVECKPNVTVKYHIQMSQLNVSIVTLHMQ